MADREPIPGCSVQLPRGARPPLRVFVDGDEVDPAEYRLEGEQIVFARPLVPARADGFLRKLTMFTAGIGFYGQGNTVDVHYTDAGGRPGVASNLKVHPPAAAGA